MINEKLIKEKAYLLSLRVVEYVQKAEKKGLKNDLLNEFLVKGTRIGAILHRENISVSRKDFFKSLSDALILINDLFAVMQKMRDKNIFSSAELKSFFDDVRYLNTIIYYMYQELVDEFIDKKSDKRPKFIHIEFSGVITIKGH